jgi:phosphocarrier protein HPr
LSRGTNPFSWNQDWKGNRLLRRTCNIGIAAQSDNPEAALNGHGWQVSDSHMKRLRIVVPWKCGLHLRPATQLVHLAKNCHSSICLKANGKMADARSILSIMLLCASLGTALDVEATGADEDTAIQAVEMIFTSADDGSDAGGDPNFKQGSP